MTRHAPTSRRATRRGLRSVPVRAVLSLGIVAGFGATGTYAYWTDDATVGGGEFLTGTLDVKLSGADNNPAGFATELTLTNMQPGQSKAAVVTVENVGTTDFVYSATGTSPGLLSDHLVYRVVPGGSVSGAGAAQTCTGGTETFSGLLDEVTPTPVIGTLRALAAGATESVCVEAKLPTGTTTGQATSTTPAFVFNAKQVGAP
ncbi:SipW-dependent-type signal peptide-containing protein [Aeromicrobium sp. Leaf350]|uniref:SipW-dependent-type signal peptide-containing protein n=1 Tax=Aeromicrobium sp. Leaf350 TaxID=2876565 RepID=UPI001E2C337D|nr:SipW-dependent-type signal peptide-containing protein [Aeromicrobium sp. Leaf350]